MIAGTPIAAHGRADEEAFPARRAALNESPLGASLIALGISLGQLPLLQASRGRSQNEAAAEAAAEGAAVSDHVLHLGDCLDALTGLATLADKSVDVFLTDPPYSEHVHGKYRRGGKMPGEEGSFSRAGELGFQAITPEQMDGFAGQAGRLSRRWVLVFCNAELIWPWQQSLTGAGLEHVRVGAWVKRDGCPQFTGDRPAPGWEAIVMAHPAGKKRWNGGGKQGVWEEAIVIPGRPGEPRLHTTQKPLALIHRLIADFTDAGELICDPFAGSGTTLVACKRLGRRAIGWEKDATFWERAVRRLENTKQQYELLPRGPKPKQVKMVLP